MLVSYYEGLFACSTSLTSKGLRHPVTGLPGVRACLQHLPDFKGIETHAPPEPCPLTSPCSTSLTSKGLRRGHVLLSFLVILAAPP